MMSRDDLEAVVRKITSEELNRREAERKAALITVPEAYAKAGVLDVKIIDLDLSIRCLNCLRYFFEEHNEQKAYKDITLRDLTKYGWGDLMKTRNFGKKSRREVELLLDKLGLRMGTTYENA